MHRTSQSRLGFLIGLLVFASVAAACSTAPPIGEQAGDLSAAQSTGGSGKGPWPTATGTAAPDPATGKAAPAAKSAFDCSGDGIAKFADQLADAAQDACNTDGPGVVTTTNYDCLKDPIFKLAPPFPDAAYARVQYWAQNGNNFAGKTTLLQCVDFAFIVTAGVCGQPINNGDAQIDENMDIPGYTYMSTSDGDPAPGDVLVLDGHIAITAEVTDQQGDIRIAEANCLTTDGQMSNGQDDTGVISNTRTDSITDSWIKGWYRKQ
jgi:hypothetical protein